MIVQHDLFTPTDLVRVMRRLRTCKADDCWRWSPGQPVVWVQGYSWRVRTLLREAFGVKGSELEECDTPTCQSPYHTSKFTSA